MNLIDITILLFVILESTNIFILYFKPDFKYGNSVSVFKHFEETKKDENLHLFIKYLVNWVANVKLMFISFLIITVIFGSNQFKLYTLMACLLSTLIYYISLAPIIKKLDNNNYINPKGYSKVLNLMILSFITIFSICLIIHL